MREAGAWTVVLIAVVLGGCAATSTPSRDSPGQRHYVGTVVKVGAVPTYNTSTDAQRNLMGSMYGGLGLAVSDVLGTKRGYPIYRVKVSEELELAIPSNEIFKEGDCVAVWVPASAGARHYFGQEEAGMEKSTACK